MYVNIFNWNMNSKARCRKRPQKRFVSQMMAHHLYQFNSEKIEEGHLYNTKFICSFN